MIEVRLDSIHVDSATNPRKNFYDIEELAEDIAREGLTNPLTVRRLTRKEEQVFPGCFYFLLAGERRFRALTLNAAERVEVKVVEPGANYVKITLQENLQRDNLTDTEAAMALAAYREALSSEAGKKLSVSDFASQISKSVDIVKKKLLHAEAVQILIEACEGQDIDSHFLYDRKLTTKVVSAVATKQVEQQIVLLRDYLEGDLRSIREIQNAAPLLTATDGASKEKPSTGTRRKGAARPRGEEGEVSSLLTRWPGWSSANVAQRKKLAKAHKKAAEALQTLADAGIPQRLWPTVKRKKSRG